MTHSTEYAEILQKTHDERKQGGKAWGTTGHRNGGPQIRDLLNAYNGVFVKSVLDYGCGQGRLIEYLQQEVKPKLKYYEYDPGIRGKDILPVEQVDMIVSTDVMEHVEPEHVDATLRQIFSTAQKAVYLLIACEKCGLILPDGRNAHLSVYETSWWKSRIEKCAPEWDFMYYADIRKRKRSGMAKYAEFHLERARN